jgi:serine protease
MTQRHKISSLLKICAATLVAAGFAGQAHAQANHAVVETDRLIVKYKDDSDTSKTGVAARGIDRARQALIDRAGQTYGATMRALRATATARTSCSSTARCRSTRRASWPPN